jgi:hypothetical protein
VYLLLDGLLGEYDVETRLAAIEIVDAPPPPNALPFEKLAAIVDGKTN